MKKYLIILLLVFNYFLNAQINIGDETAMDNSAVIQVNSNNQGVIIPRMSSLDMKAINEPATGLMVYNTTQQCLSTNDGTPKNPAWTCSSDFVTSWFYLPSFTIDTREIGEKSVDLYNQVYLANFLNNVISSDGSKLPIEPLSNLNFYVTDYDNNVLQGLSIDANGVLRFNVTKSGTDCTVMNIVITKKQ